MDPRTISGYFIGYAEKSRDYKFYYPLLILKIVDALNEKVIKNDDISESTIIQKIKWEETWSQDNIFMDEGDLIIQKKINIIS